jgi:uncharacterized membrane protein HdeD (DUF308 family)
MKNWLLWLIVGILSVIAGIVALANPFAATITANMLAGYMFAAIGILMLLTAFQDQGWGARLWALLLGGLITVFGVNLITHPLEGILKLTFIVGILMLIIGVFRIVIALTPMAAGARGFLILAGVISIVLGGMILTNFPYSSAVVLGIFLAIELISNGVAMIFVALDRKEPEAT